MDEFLEHDVQKAGAGNRIYCLCLRFGNKSLHPIRDVKCHIYFNDINSSYQRWIWHGERASSSTSVNFNDTNMVVGIDDNVATQNLPRLLNRKVRKIVMNIF